MIDFNTLKVSVQEWLVRSSGLTDDKMVFNDQADIRPDKPYIAMKITSLVDIGQDDARGAIDVNGNSDFIGNREFTLSIQHFGDNSLNTLSLVRDSLNDDVELQTLRDTGIIFVDQLLFSDITSLLETIWEERGQLDLLMRTVSISNHQVGIIDGVDMSGKYLAADGSTIKDSNIII